MIQLLSFLSLLCSAAAFLVAALIYKLVIVPYFDILFYKRQGGKAMFHREIIPHLKALKDMNQKGDYYHQYRQLARENPNEKFFVENFGSSAQLLLIDPDMIKEFFQKYDLFYKDRAIIGIMEVLGVGSVVLAEGADWKRRRRLISHAFHFDYLKQSIPMITAVTQEKFNDWINQGTLNHQSIHEKIALIAGEVVTRFMFGAKASEKKVNGVPISIAIKHLVPEVLEEGFTPQVMIFGPKILNASWIPRYKKLQEKIDGMRTACKELIREKKESHKKEGTVLDILFDSQENVEEEDKITEEDIIGEFVGLFTAGTNTSSNVMSVTMFYMYKNPEVFEKVIEEVEREFKDPANITIENINSMNYLSATIKEAMRYGGPTGNLFSRIAMKDGEVGGVKIKKGTKVNFCHDILCRSEKYYTNPDKFAPERWLGDATYSNDAIKKEPYAFVPFSGGPRICVGQNLALIEAKIVISMFIKTFNVKFSDEYELIRKQSASYIPRDPMLVNMSVKTN